MSGPSEDSLQMASMSANLSAAREAKLGLGFSCVCVCVCVCVRMHVCKVNVYLRNLEPTFSTVECLYVHSDTCMDKMCNELRFES
jgi:hypothetical protein